MTEQTEQAITARRDHWRQQKREQRSRRADERQAIADLPPPGGAISPPMPAGLRAIRQWLRGRHDAYSRREITSAELAEHRRSASSVGDLYRVGADLRKAEAAIRAAVAQERMAEVLAAVEHGGVAVAMLARLQDSLTDGRRRPLPGRTALEAGS